LANLRSKKNGSGSAEIRSKSSAELGNWNARFIGGLMMRKDKDESAQLDRRHLLKGAVLGAVGATSVGVANAASPATADDKPQHAGYRESEDVLKYYKLARF
jgi:hypothetical protein